MVRIAVVISITLCLGGCRNDPPPPPAPEPATPVTPAAEAEEKQPTAIATPEADDPFRDFNWSAVSSDGTAVLMQTHVGNAKCRRTCNDAPGAKEVWSADGCVGKRIDLRFVANDCGKAVVLHQLPEVKGGQRWQEIEVAHVYKQGTLAYAVDAAGAVRDFKKIRSAGTTFYWLAGALNVPGVPPKYSADGNAVEFATVDGKKQSIPLTGK
jgi:hypothetical protein